MRHVQPPGRRSGADRLTHAGVLNRLGPQTDGVVSWRDPTALPCSHPHCCSVGYMLRTDQGEWRSLVAIMGHDELKSRLDLVSNTIADWQAPAKLRLLVKESLLGLLSEQSSLTHPTVTDLLRNICENCDLGMATGDAAASGPGYDQCAPFLRRAGPGPAGPAEADIGVRDAGARAGQGGGAACSRLSGTVPRRTSGSAGTRLRPPAVLHLHDRGLLAWAIGPPVVAVMAALGLWAHARAWRAGLRRSRCFLGDVTLVAACLAVAVAVGTIFTILAVL